jgi:two-component system, OmpR family, sensor histidine kinase MprB
VSFRRRLTLAAAAAVAVVVLLTSVAAYGIVRGELRGQIDNSLRERAEPLLRMGARPDGPFMPGPPGPRPERLGGPAGYVQLIDAEGRARRSQGGTPRLPVDGATAGLARRGGEPSFSDADVNGTHVRVLTTPLPGGGAVQIARPLDEVDQVLADLRLILGAVLVLGVALALLLGRLVTRTALQPVERLTEASEHVATTADLSRRIEVQGSDELGRLAASFNTMLDALERTVAALDQSLVAQRRLVADASHELRTPLTSLRTNIDVLRDADKLPDEQRRELLDDVGAQLDELTLLVGDLVQLARDDEQPLEPQDVRLDRVVAEAVERHDRHARDVRFETRLEPTVVEGIPDRLDRAVSNLLDNAAKFSPPRSTVEVVLERGELSVRDHGPGIDPADLPHVFDRFYRSAAARAVPGSGLGLAIVRQVAEGHGGTVSAEPAPGGGTRFLLVLPALEAARATSWAVEESNLQP